MYYYRITKYNPKYRDDLGRYLVDEWTDFSDIGGSFRGNPFTFQEYERVEKAYIKSVMLFIKCENISWLKCGYIEKSLDDTDIHELPNEWKKLYHLVSTEYRVAMKDIPIILKLMLRNLLFCKLEHTDRMFIHIGYDYYMYVGVKKYCSKALEQIPQLGVYVESFKSPYLEVNDGN